MDIWCEARERYAGGGVTQKQLAKMYGLPIGSLRRRAAQEGWSALRAARSGGNLAADSSGRISRINRQLELTDRMLDVVERALSDEDELFGWVEYYKSTSESRFTAERLQYLNDERFSRLVRAAAEVFELQRTVLEIHEFKDELSARKLQKDAEFAERRLELELLKLENAQNACEADNFLAALGLAEAAGEEKDE